MKHTFSDGALAGESVDQLKARLRIEADRIHDDDVASWEADWSALSLRTGLMLTREAANTVYRPMTQSAAQQRCRAMPTASSADFPGR